MSISAVRDALSTLTEDLDDWLTGEAERDGLARDIARLEAGPAYLEYLRGVKDPEHWQRDELRRLEATAESDRRWLDELRDRRQRHQAATARVTAAERVLFHFAEQHGIDAGPLARLVVLGESVPTDELLLVLRRIAFALDRQASADANARDEARAGEQGGARRRAQSAPAQPPAGQPTIWFHGGQSYSVDGRNPRYATAEQHSVLQAFLDGNEALPTSVLADKVNNPSVVIKKLVRRFGEAAIRRPEEKGDGYFIRVRPLSQTD